MPLTATPARGLLAAAASATVLALALAGCAQSSSEETKPTKSPKPTSSQGESTGGGLPFPPFGGPETPPPTEGPSTTPGPSSTTGPSSPGGGTDTVKFGSVDLSHINWDVVCYGGSSASVYGYNGDAPLDSTESSGSIMITTDETGKVDFMLVSGGDFTEESLYYDGAPESGSVTFSMSGGSVTATGEAYEFSDYNRTKPLQFELELACDSTF